MSTMMIPSEIEHHLRDLSEIDIANLRLGRITRQVMAIAMDRANKWWPDAMQYRDVLSLVYAEELNHMLEAARASAEKGTWHE